MTDTIDRADSNPDVESDVDDTAAESAGTRRLAISQAGFSILNAALLLIAGIWSLVWVAVAAVGAAITAWLLAERLKKRSQQRRSRTSTARSGESRTGGKAGKRSKNPFSKDFWKKPGGKKKTGKSGAGPKGSGQPKGTGKNGKPSRADKKAARAAKKANKKAAKNGGAGGKPSRAERKAARQAKKADRKAAKAAKAQTKADKKAGKKAAREQKKAAKAQAKEQKKAKKKADKEARQKNKNGSPKDEPKTRRWHRDSPDGSGDAPVPDPKTAPNPVPVPHNLNDQQPGDPNGHRPSQGAHMSFGRQYKENMETWAAQVAAWDPEKMPEFGTEMPELAEGMRIGAKALQNMTAKVGGELPLHPALVGFVAQTAAMQNKTADATEAVAPAFRNMHVEDNQRHENPRTHEEKWNV